MIRRQSPQFPAIVAFVLQVVGGAVCFAVVAGVAYALSYGIDLMAKSDVLPATILTALRGVELMLFSADILCMAAFVLVESVALLKALWSKLIGTA